MTKAVKKPVVIDYLPSGSSPTQLKNWVASFNDKLEDHFELTDKGYTVDLKVKTLEGTSYNVTEKDVIIRGIKGEYYPCKENIFEQTYDKL